MESYVPVSFKTQSKQSGKYNHSRPLHASTQGAAGTCTHLASYGVGVLLSPQAQDFLNRPQAQCTPSRAVCMHTCFQRCFEFQPRTSIIAADSSTPFLLRVCFCLLIRGWKCSWTDGLRVEFLLKTESGYLRDAEVT